MSYKEQKNERKTFVKVPCKVGDKLWCINNYNKLEKVECLGLFIRGDGIIVICYQEEDAEEVYYVPFGTIIFKTKSEAKKRLATWREREICLN